MIRLWRRHRVLVSAFALALALTLFFAVRIVVQAVYWANHRDEAVQPWMTLGYVSHSWQVPPDLLAERLGFQRPEGRPLTLLEQAVARGEPVADLIARVEAAVAALKAEEAARHPAGDAP